MATSKIKKALTTETLTGTTSATTYDGYYYADFTVDTSGIISAIVTSLDSNQSGFCQIVNNHTLRVWSKKAGASVSVKITRG